MRKVRWIFLLTFGGVGLVLLAVGLVIGFSSVGMVMDGALQGLRWMHAGMGVLFMLVGAGIFFALGRGDKRRDDLLGYGRRVQGEVLDVKHNYAIRVNRRSPWRVQVRCTHPLTGEELILYSRSLWTCSYKPGDRVDVLFDPMDEKKYAVDAQEAQA